MVFKAFKVIFQPNYIMTHLHLCKNYICSTKLLLILLPLPCIIAISVVIMRFSFPENTKLII